MTESAAAAAVGPPGFALPPDAVRPARSRWAPPAGTVLPYHYEHCYACGESEQAGLHLIATAGDGLTVTGELQVTAAHQGAPGLAHGGLIATAFDETLGFLLMLLATPVVTARLETQYRSPVPVGRLLRIDAQITGVSGRKTFTHGVGRLDGPGGLAVAEASGLFVTVGLEHFSAHSPVQELTWMTRGQAGATRPARPGPYNP